MKPSTIFTIIIAVLVLAAAGYMIWGREHKADSNALAVSKDISIDSPLLSGSADGNQSKAPPSTSATNP